jgi:hypothetical protein
VGMNFNFAVKRFLRSSSSSFSPEKNPLLYRALKIFLLLFFIPIFQLFCCFFFPGYSGLIYFGEDFMFEEFLYSSVADDV